MKGKEAAQAANRRLEAIEGHVDRLTNELVTARIRARDAEARAARLEGVEALLRAKANDQMLIDALESLKKWKHWWKVQGDRSKKAIAEMGNKLWFDLDLPGAERVTTTVDKMEFLAARYPAIMNAVTGGSTEDWHGHATTRHRGHFEEKLDDASLVRFQKLMGERLELGGSAKEAAEVWSDLLDAQHAGFSLEEAVQYATEE